jgi:hypothetical protein
MQRLLHAMAYAVVGFATVLVANPGTSRATVLILNGCGDQNSPFGDQCSLSEIVEDNAFFVADKFFGAFHFNGTLAGPEGAALDPVKIRFDILDPDVTGGDPGFRLVDEAGAGLTQNSFLGMVADLNFTVQVTGSENPFRIHDNTLEVSFIDMSASGGGEANAHVFEQVFAQALDGTVLDQLGDKFVECNVDTAVGDPETHPDCSLSTGADHLVFDPHATIRVFQTIRVLSRQDDASDLAPFSAVAGIEAITVTFSQIRVDGPTVPEPGLLGLLGTGLAALAILRVRGPRRRADRIG